MYHYLTHQIVTSHICLKNIIFFYPRYQWRCNYLVGKILIHVWSEIIIYSCKLILIMWYNCRSPSARSTKHLTPLARLFNLHLWVALIMNLRKGRGSPGHRGAQFGNLCFKLYLFKPGKNFSCNKLLKVDLIQKLKKKVVETQ